MSGSLVGNVAWLAPLAPRLQALFQFMMAECASDRKKKKNKGFRRENARGAEEMGNKIGKARGRREYGIHPRLKGARWPIPECSRKCNQKSVLWDYPLSSGQWVLSSISFWTRSNCNLMKCARFGKLLTKKET